VRSSAALREVLLTVLAVGNELNVGTSHGGAQGFALDTLLKLQDVKVTHADACNAQGIAQRASSIGNGVHGQSMDSAFLLACGLQDHEKVTPSARLLLAGASEVEFHPGALRPQEFLPAPPGVWKPLPQDGSDEMWVVLVLGVVGAGGTPAARTP
jgi:Formin Homology 2 Domain